LPNKRAAEEQNERRTGAATWTISPRIQTIAAGHVAAKKPIRRATLVVGGPTKFSRNQVPTSLPHRLLGANLSPIRQKRLPAGRGVSLPLCPPEPSSLNSRLLSHWAATSGRMLRQSTASLLKPLPFPQADHLGREFGPIRPEKAEAVHPGLPASPSPRTGIVNSTFVNAPPATTPGLPSEATGPLAGESYSWLGFSSAALLLSLRAFCVVKFLGGVPRAGRPGKLTPGGRSPQRPECDLISEPIFCAAPVSTRIPHVIGKNLRLDGHVDPIGGRKGRPAFLFQMREADFVVPQPVGPFLTPKAPGKPTGGTDDWGPS